MAQRELQLRVGVELGNTQQRLQALNSNIKLATAEFKNASAGIEGFENTTEGLQAKLKQLNTAYQQSARKVEILKEAIEGAKNTLKQTNDAYDNQKDKVKQLERELEKAKSTYGETSKEVKDLEQALEKENRTLKQNETAVRNADNNLNKLKTQLNDAERQAKEFAQEMDNTNESLQGMRSESPFGNMLGDLQEMGAGFGELKGKIGAVIEVVGKLTKAFIDLGVNSLKWLGGILKNIVTIGAKIGGVVTGIAGFSVKLAGDFQATEEMINATFGDNLKEAESVMKSFSEKTGIYAGRVQEPFAKMYSQFKSAGADAPTSLGKLDKAMQVVADASAYYNISFEEAEERVRSFLRMNLEAGDSIGLTANEMARNEKATELYGKKFKDLTEEQRQFTLLEIADEIYKQSGAFEQAIRESSSLENVMGNLIYISKEFVATMGKGLLEPAIEEIKEFAIMLSRAKEIMEEKGLVQAFQYLVDCIVAKLNTMADHIPEVMSNVINAIVMFINESLPQLFDLGTKIIQNISRGLVDNQQLIAEGISKVIGQVAKFVNDNAPAILEGGKAILDALRQGLTENKDIIEDAVKNITETAVTLFLDYKSLIIEAGLTIGGEFMAGIWKGIWKKGTERKPINDNFFVPPSEVEDQASKTATVWVNTLNGTISDNASTGDQILSAVGLGYNDRVQVFAGENGFAYVNGVKTKVSELAPEVQEQVGKMFENLETAKEEGNKTGKANAEGVKEGVKQAKEEVKGATKEVAVESSQAMLDELSNLTPETYKKFLDVVQTIRQAGSDMYNGVKTSFSRLGEVAKTEMTSMYKGVTESFNQMQLKGKQHASSLYNGAKTSFVNLANVGKNQFSNLYRDVTSYADKMRRDVIDDWRTMADYIQNRKISGTVTIKRNTVNSVSNVPDAQAMGVALSGSYYNPNTRESLAVNETIAMGSSKSNDQAKLVNDLVKSNNATNTLLMQMIEVLVAGKTIQVDNIIELDGRKVAQGTAKYMETEIETLNKRNRRKVGGM